MSITRIDQSSHYPKLWEITSWKTKTIHKTTEWLVIMENHDDITAGDWAKKDNFNWKWRLSTQITSNVFEYLNKVKIPTAFKKRIWDNEMLCEELDMLPFEIVFRNVATWSYIKRQQAQFWENAIKDWTVLDNPIYEVFYKNDIWVDEDNIILINDIIENTNWKPQFKTNEKWEITIDQSWKKEKLSNLRFLDIESWNEIEPEILLKWKYPQIKIIRKISDPMIKINEIWLPSTTDQKDLIFIDPKTWEKINVYSIINPHNLEPISKDQYLKDLESIKRHSINIKHLTERTFEQLQLFFTTEGIKVFDWKIEFGLNKNWELKLWDVIDADSCRLRKVTSWIENLLWVKIVQWEAFDKQWFREWEEISTTQRKYEALAKITDSCLNQILKLLSTTWQLAKALKG